MKSKEEDSMFNMMEDQKSTTSSKQDFLKQFNVEEKPAENKKQKQIKISKEEFIKNNF